MSEIIDPASSSKASVPAATSWPLSTGCFTAASRSGGETSQGITFQFVWTTVRRWWKVALPAGVLLAATGGTLMYALFRPVYLASAWLRIDDRAPFIAFEAKDIERSNRFVQTQIEMLRSPLVLGPVLSEPDIAIMPEIVKSPDRVQWLSKQLKVSSVGDSELFTVSFSSETPTAAARIVNAAIDSYFRLREQDAAERVQRVIELLDQEKERRSTEVSRLRENVQELTKQATGKDPFDARPAADATLRHPFAELQARLTTAEVEREILKAQITAFEESLSKQKVEASEGMVERAVEAAPRVQFFVNAIVEKEVRIDEVEQASVMGAKDPACRQLRAKLSEDEKALKKAREETRKRVKAELEASLEQKRRDDLSVMRSELTSREIAVQMLQQRSKSQLGEIRQSGGKTLELEFKRSELVRAEDVLDRIANRITTLRTEQRAPTRVSLLRKAEVPTAPVELVPYRNVTLVSLAGLLLPFLLTIAWERMVQRVSDSRQLEEHSNLTVVGEIARLPMRTANLRGAASRRVGQDLRTFEESIDSLRTSLVLSEQLKGMRVLTVTSAVNHEGKTSVAAQLAVSLARASGELTLLIDGDLRSPDVHSVFEVPLEPGLANVLNQECPLEAAIVTSWSKHVHLLPAGRLQTSPHKLFGNGALKSIVDKIPSIYRYVVIDTPPVLAASESLVVAKAADASLLCVMRDVSRLDQVKKAWGRLAAAGGHPVGVVLNGIPTRQYGYRYGRYAYSQG